MTWQQYLEHLKCLNADAAWLHSYDNELVIQASKAWTEARVMIHHEHLIGFTALDDNKKRFNMLWNAISYDNLRWKSFIMSDVDTGFLVRLINSMMIYPDGTCNEEAIQQILVAEMREDKKH